MPSLISVSRFKHQSASTSGFTLVELLLGSILILIAASGAAVVVSSSGNTLQASRRIDRLQALVDDDVAKVRELSARFSCCSGACGIGTSGCRSEEAGDDRFYYPIATDVLPPDFLEGPNGDTGLCNNGGIGVQFAAAIELNSPVSAEFFNADLERQRPIRVDSTDGTNHIVRLRYVGPDNTGINRIVDILPPAASWCP